jgi:HSP20 family protein
MATTSTTLEKKAEERVRPWDPLLTFEGMEEEFRRLWNDPWSLLYHRPARGTFRVPTTWYPRADMFEKSGTLFVKMDLPGLRKEDIQVSLDNGDLVIQGESKFESEVKEDDYYRIERSAGKFYRRLALPFEATTSKMEATFKEGVLEIKIPRPAEAKKPEPQKITVL